METNNIYEYAKKIKTKEDFLCFMNLLMKDYQENGEQWENNTLHLFFNGIEGYIYDSSLKKEIDWQELAEIFLAARVYE